MDKNCRDREKTAAEITEALRRAGAQAREVARATGTPMVRGRDGEVVEVYLDPTPRETSCSLQEGQPLRGARLPKVSNLF